MDEKSIFEKVIDGEIISEIIYEDDEIFAINDINPVARVHVLIIPKKRIKTINDIEIDDIDLMGKMIFCAKKLAIKYSIDTTGYRLIFNTHSDANQTIFNIHLHLIGGEKLKNIWLR